MSVTDEINLMKRTINALEKLPPAARQRVVNYLSQWHAENAELLSQPPQQQGEYYNEQPDDQDLDEDI